ncbi:MAG TPA: MBL fold metallo-hydrolase [Thermoflexia bacterium]|jgi:glyoxylase-like metal-dependent hydrolase (beta-lactamase superfamily II)|nr:MBL fold metallo-hydrolase [Thermoflexia bacterium]
MRVVELTSGVFHLQGGVNMGLVVQDGKGLLIDAGLDKDAARRALRVVEGMDVTLEAVFLTHAHADHFGGAYLLQRRLGIPAYAPPLEAAMMEHPIMEPVFLYGGAAPIQALRHKFTLAKPCQVDHVVGSGPLTIGPFQVDVVPLPGHAPNQVGVAVGDVLFCADAVFPTETLQKHKVIFCADMDDALETLERLPGMPYAHFAPGHGPTYEVGEEIADICRANRERLEAIREEIYAATESPRETGDLVQHVADRFDLQLTTPTAYYLTRTTVLAALTSLEGDGKVKAIVKDNRLMWERQT